MGSVSVGSVALWKPPLGMEGDLKEFSELPEEPKRGGLAQGFTRGVLPAEQDRVWRNGRAWGAGG